MMEPRFLLPGLLACVLCCATVAAEEANNEQGTADTGPETMEHVEVIGYPVPEVSTREDEADKPLIAEQFREELRQDLLQEHNRRELMSAIRYQQLQQLEAFRIAGEGQDSEEVAQEVQAQPVQPLEELKPAALTIEADTELEEEATAIEPATDNQAEEEALQEPS